MSDDQGSGRSFRNTCLDLKTWLVFFCKNYPQPASFASTFSDPPRRPRGSSGQAALHITGDLPFDHDQVALHHHCSHTAGHNPLAPGRARRGDHKRHSCRTSGRATDSRSLIDFGPRLLRGFSAPYSSAKRPQHRRRVRRDASVRFSVH